MTRRKLSPRRAAALLGRHPNSVYNWCRAAERGEPTVLTRVERAANGYFQIDAEEVRNLLSNCEREDDEED